MADDEITALAKSRLGRVLRGKYRLDSVLGIGGMATVYAATHRNKKRFAIKMLHPEFSLRETIRTRFIREGYVANSVEHTGAVAVLDDDVAEDGSAFLVMELLEGTTVDDLRVSGARTLPLALALSIGDALLDVLVAAHEKRIVHRDLKPANLFVTNDGRLEVLDFGIARLHDETSATAESTQTGAMMGTPAFMAPEQALAETAKVDAQTDLWAVGATLFTLLSGRLVHEGDNASQLLVNAATKKAPGLATVIDVPAPVAAVIDRALAFEKGERWASATAMRDALRAACLEATGTAVLPLPTRAALGSGAPEVVTGDGATVAATDGDVAFGPTVSADSLGHAATTTSGASSTGSPKGSEAAPRRAWLAPVVIAGAVVAAAVAAVRMHRTPPDAPAAAAQTSSRPPPAGSAEGPMDPSAFETLFPCKDTRRELAPAGLLGECTDDQVPWCSQQGKTVACCSAGLVAVHSDGECGCPPNAIPVAGESEAGPTDKYGCHDLAGNTEGMGRLPPEEIQAVVRAGFGNIRKCYEDGLQRFPSMKGRVSVYFEIARNGEVFYARLVGAEIADPKAQACMLGHFSKLHFPPPIGGVVTVTYPIVFSHGD